MPARIITLLLAIAMMFGVTLTSATSTLTPPHVFSSAFSVRSFADAYTPAQIQTAYDYASLLNDGIDGTGQTAALVEIDGLDHEDLRRFDETYDLPIPRLSEHYLGGHPFRLESSAETALDVEWLHALAPGAAIQIYYLYNHFTWPEAWKTLARGLRTIRANGASIVSMSVGACGPGSSAGPTRRALADLERSGVSVFASSGDSGDHPGPAKYCGTRRGVNYPGGDPSIVSVGGTSLHLAGDDTISGETAWPMSGGGNAAGLPRSPWQRASSLPAGGSRWTPDVAFLADPGTGVRFLWHGAWLVAGGTSLGAPAWAAAWALVRDDAQTAGIPIAAAPSLLYTLGNSSAAPTVFHDILRGTNGAYHAAPGWDPVTGWGTPSVGALAAAVLSTRHAR